MIKTLQKRGNSHALVIDKAVMQVMGITEQTPLQITVTGSTLTVTPTEVGLGDERVTASITRLRRRYSGMLDSLAK